MLKGIHLGRQPLASIEPHDQRILQLLSLGQYKGAFVELRVAYQCKLHHLCVVLLRDRALAEDVLQESLLRIYQALYRYDGRASLYTWMYAITRNQCCTVVRRGRDPLSLVETDWESDPESASASDLDPQETAIRQEDVAQVRDLVARLPEVYRQVVLLFYWGEQSVSEVAKLLSLPEGTVKTRLHRARVILEDRLRRRGLDEVDLGWGTGQ
jgi:RNA polymerase sigma-70 factor, ECF subfamily